MPGVPMVPVMGMVHGVVSMRVVAVGVVSAVVPMGMVGRVHSGVFPLLVSV